MGLLRDAPAGLRLRGRALLQGYLRGAGGGLQETGGRADCGTLQGMIGQIAPVFFTLDIPRTVAFFSEKLGFECLSVWPGDGDPPVYAIVSRDGRAIHFRCAPPPGAQADKYEDELLDAYLFVEDADALYAEYAAKGVEFTRTLGDTPWQTREFVVKDCDGRLLAFGANR